MQQHKQFRHCNDKKKQLLRKIIGPFFCVIYRTRLLNSIEFHLITFRCAYRAIRKSSKKVSLVAENTKCILTKRPEILSSPIKHSSYFFPFYSFVFLLIREKTHRDAIKQQLLNNIARKKQRSLNAPARECDVRKMEVTNSDFS